VGVQTSAFYWTINTDPIFSAKNAVAMDSKDGGFVFFEKDSFSAFAWCVRTGKGPDFFVD
jgi:hypothetical protein